MNITELKKESVYFEIWQETEPAVGSKLVSSFRQGMYYASTEIESETEVTLPDFFGKLLELRLKTTIFTGVGEVRAIIFSNGGSRRIPWVKDWHKVVEKIIMVL